MYEHEFLTEKRKELDLIDSRITELLLKRYRTITEIGMYKINNKIKILDRNREEEILNRIKALSDLVGESDFLIGVYTAILDESKKIQRNLTE